VSGLSDPSQYIEGVLPPGISRSMLRLALDEGRPVLLTDCYGESVDSSDSIVLSGLRSALCASISSQGEPVAFLYVTHASVAGLFGTAEVQMADFITTLAGAALDHVANTEARFRSLAQNSSDVITIIDRDGTIEYQSAAVMRVFGFEQLSLVGTTITQWLHADDVERVRNILDDVASGQRESLSFECRLHHHDGSWRYVETALNDLTDDPSVDGFVLNTRDITDRKAAEHELRETLDHLTAASSLLNATLDATIDGILVVNLSGRTTSFNQRFLEIWGIPNEVLADRDDQAALDYVIDQLVEPEQFLQKIRDLYADPNAESTDVIELKSGRVLERGSKPQRIGFDVVGRVWCFRDVTERQRSAEALAIARDEAMEASRLKSEFVATTSHEIRSPMNGVIGLTSLLLETDLNQTQREFAEGVRNSAEALLVVINDILDFSKIEAGKLDLEDVGFDVAVAVDEVIGLVSSAAAAKGLVLRSDYDDAVPRNLIGDVGRLRQILLNLLTNAVKFTEQGSVAVHVGAGQPRLDGRVAVRISIEDTGVGLNMSDRDRLFEPFSQADASTTRRYGGTGLGLTICHRLAHAMQGSIGVHSEIGVGSTFWTEIPFAVQAVEPVALQPPPAPRAVTARAKAKKARLLIVEDNAINQLVAKEIVTRLGYTYEIAANGIEALRALEERGFAAVLMDCYMPDMDGFEATRELRLREQGKSHTPVIAMTAGAMVEDRERCIVAGMDDYVAKPVTPAALEAVLDRWAS
jgi:PAS domain S-box-containing protein